MRKEIFVIGTIAYAVLAVLAVVFYVERTAFVDMAFHLFYLIKDGHLAIQNYRFGAAVTQVFPMLGSKLGLSLKQLMYVYSLVFVLLDYAIFFVNIRVFKSARFGAAMLLLSTLMVTDTFYWMLSELRQGMALMWPYFLFLGYVSRRDTTPWWYLPVSVVALMTFAFLHPLMVFPFTFVALFLLLEKRDRHYRMLLAGHLTGFWGVYVIKSLFFKTAYESGAMGGLHNFITLFPNYFTLESDKRLLSYALHDYYLLYLLFFALLGYYVMRREIWKLLLLAGFFIGYTLVINVSYPKGADQFYIENMYLPLSVMVILPLVYEAPRVLSKRWLLISLAVIVAIRLVHIGLSHTPYTNRVAYLKRIMATTAEQPRKKIIMDERYFSKDTLIMSWGTPYEIWLLSTMDGGPTRSIMIAQDAKRYEWVRGVKDKFVPTWGAFEYKDLPPRYFHFSDTSGYVVKTFD